MHRQSTSFSESLLVVLYSVLARKLHSGCCLSTVKHLVLRKTSRSRPASERAAAVGVSRTDGRRFPLSLPSMRAAVYRRRTQQAPAFRHQVGALSLSLSLSPSNANTFPRCRPAHLAAARPPIPRRRVYVGRQSGRRGVDRPAGCRCNRHRCAIIAAPTETVKRGNRNCWTATFHVVHAYLRKRLDHTTIDDRPTALPIVNLNPNPLTLDVAL